MLGEKTEPPTAPEAQPKDPTTMVGMVKGMSKLGGTGVIKESMKTFSSIEGKDKNGDVFEADEGMAIARLTDMAAAAEAKASGTKKTKWRFATSPHAAFGKTLDDVFAAFVRWATADEEELTAVVGEGAGGASESGGGGAAAAVPRPNLSINVSKAFRRLEAYAEWMHATGTDLVMPPLTADSVATAAAVWGMRLNTDKYGRWVVWFDMGSLDFKAVKALSAEASLRYFVWYANWCMFEETAQQRGMVVAENVAQCGFWQCCTMMPMKLGIKIDRLTLGVLPIKMKRMIITDSSSIRPLQRFCSLILSRAYATPSPIPPRYSLFSTLVVQRVYGVDDALHVQEDAEAHPAAQGQLGGRCGGVGCGVRAGRLRRGRRHRNPRCIWR